jgi:hypothetical protein
MIVHRIRFEFITAGLALAVTATVPAASHETAWLGQYSDRDRVRRSGLWHNNHVEEAYDSSFLKTLEAHVVRARQI